MNPNTFLKQLLFSTVRIEAETSSGTSVGTGFLVSKKISDTQEQIFLITNKHVVAPVDDKGKVIGKFGKGFFTFSKSENNNPKFGQPIPVTVPNLTDAFLLHSDVSVDLAICNISDVYNKITNELKQEVFIRSIPLDMIPDKSCEFDAIEDVVFVGYPNGLYDQENHLPIIRKGITASAFEIDFNGAKKFLVDAHVFPGSSGSPVFIKEQNLKHGSLRLGQEKYFFVGIISAVYFRDEMGTILIPPTHVSENFSVKQMIGLGVCEKSNQIIDMIEILNKQNK